MATKAGAKPQPKAKARARQPKAKALPPEPKQHGLGVILLTIALSTGLFAALGVLAAHVFH